MVAFLLVIVGALNWGLIGLLNFDLVAWLFIDTLGVAMLADVVYVLVGVAAVYELLTHKSTCTHCGAGGSSGMAREASMSPDNSL